MYATGHAHYRAQATTTASPAQLVLMLLDGGIAEVARAQRALAAAPVDIGEAHDCLQRAQAIVTELSVSLDRRGGGQIADGLGSLYTYCLELLVDANVRKSAEPLVHVTTVLADLREAWEAACCGQTVDRVPAGLSA